MLPSRTQYSNLDYIEQLKRAQAERKAAEERKNNPSVAPPPQPSQHPHQHRDNRQHSHGHNRGQRENHPQHYHSKPHYGHRRHEGDRNNSERPPKRHRSDDSQSADRALHANSHYDFETGVVDPHYPSGWDTTCTLVKQASDYALPEMATMPLWDSYNAELITTFSQPSDDKSEPTRDIPSLADALTIPGMPPLWREPELPIRFKRADAEGSVQVRKPPLVSLVMVAEKAGLNLLSSAPAIDASSESQPSPGYTFIGARNSLRSMLDGRKNTWRVDLQRVGTTVFIRRHLDYAFDNNAEIGHLFEKACVSNGESVEGRAFRGIVRGRVGHHTLITSSEIDAIQAETDANNGTDADVGSGAKLTVSMIRELKTSYVHDGKKYHDKLKTYWLQSFLGGVTKIMLGVKQDDNDSVAIQSLRELRLTELMGDIAKQTAFNKLFTLLSFIASLIEEGKVYKLVREKSAPVSLYKIVDGISKHPIVDDAVMASIRAWAASQST